MLSASKNKISLNPQVIRTYDDYEPEFYRVHPCPRDWISTALREEVKLWEPRCPCLIDAGTGAGKTEAIKALLIPDALAHGKNLLLISNRVAVSTQQKRSILKMLDCSRLEKLTDEGLQEEEDFGAVRIITYHRLPALLKDPGSKEWLSNLKYVVADEAHFFVSDSKFNEKCDLYLKLITTSFSHAIRVYMTATSWDVLHPLAEAEKKNFFDHTIITSPYAVYSRQFHHYIFQPDYSNIDLNFFNDLDEIEALIEQDDSSKWLVFINNKEKGRAFADKLNELTTAKPELPRALFIDSGSKSSSQWNQLLKNESFESQVLITTSVLDCGMNIKDNALKNVVILSDDRTSLVQSLGRKRLRPGEKVTLFVQSLSQQTLTSRYAQHCSYYGWYARYISSTPSELHAMLNEIWNSNDPVLRKLFQPRKGYLYPNKLALFSLGRKIKFYETMRSQKTSFENVVRGWFGKSSILSAEAKQSLVDFCANNLGSKLSESEFASFRDMVVASYQEAGFTEPQHTRLDKLEHQALCNRLETIGLQYRVSKDYIIYQIKEESKWPISHMVTTVSSSVVTTRMPSDA